jgi:hypothetical protein
VGAALVGTALVGAGAAGAGPVGKGPVGKGPVAFPMGRVGLVDHDCLQGCRIDSVGRRTGGPRSNKKLVSEVLRTRWIIGRGCGLAQQA